MRYLSLLFFLLVGLFAQSVFADEPPHPEGCAQKNFYGGSHATVNATRSACLSNSSVNLIKSFFLGSTPYVRCLSCINPCFEGQVYDPATKTCTTPPPDPGPDEECQAPNVKNIETGACEPKTDCEYPLLYDSYSNSCFANPNHCAEGSKPNPIDPGTCIAYGDTSCPNGWVPINDGLNCAPGGNASSAAGASSAPPASSAAAASSTPASTPASTPTSSPSSTPSDGGDDSGSGDGGGGGSGSGGNSGTGGTGSGSASSSNSSGAGSGSGSGGSGECDPTSPDYLDCISRDTGDEGEGLDEVNQKDYGLNIGDRLQQARDDYTDRLNQIQDEFSQSVSVSLGSGSGSLPRNTVTLYGESVEMGIYARRDFFDAIRWIFLAVATVLSLYIVLSR